MKACDASRRDFLRGAVAATTLAPGVTLTIFAAAEARPAGEAASAKVRWGLLVDVNKCSQNCDACVRACFVENGLGEARSDTDAQWIRKVVLKDPVTAEARSAPVMCQHCGSAPCVDVCPTGASFKRADGVVLVDKHICIGCRYCMMACPFKARSFVHEDHDDQVTRAPRGKGTVEGCTLCVTRIDAGQQPACVEACAREGGALVFGDLNDPGGEIRKALRQYPATRLRADLGVDPGVFYAHLK